MKPLVVEILGMEVWIDESLKEGEFYLSEEAGRLYE